MPLLCFCDLCMEFFGVVFEVGLMVEAKVEGNSNVTWAWCLYFVTPLSLSQSHD